MENSYRVGVDVGSTTIKIVVLDESDRIVFQEYLRHFSNITATLKEMVETTLESIPKQLMSVMFTGSAALGLSKCMDFSFVQEVIACTQAVKQMIPDTDTAIELGGEDAKITYFGSSVEQRMNGVCAGGTGAFIDQMASLLDTDAGGLNELAKHCKNVYPIASRCGVFAKTDVQALMNEGVSKEDIAASVLQAVVNQTIGSLAQGRPIKGKVALLGGPLHFLSELRQRFIDTLKLKPEQVINPESSPYFVAIGAALSSKEKPVPCECMYSRIPGVNAMSAEGGSDRLAPLFADEQELAVFRERHAGHVVPKGNLSEYRGKAYLGIDAGSTTTKLALVGEGNKLLYSYYGSNQGKPLTTVVTALKKLYDVLPPQVAIAGSAATGYGERLIKAALQVDLGEVETIAHLKAAAFFVPDVSFVMDIGGQDMKSFVVHDGVIESIKLNEACSSGCGSFIETFANSVGLSVQDFAALALQAEHPVDLGTRCTVFMNSKVKQAQKEGATVAEISAGLAISVIKNALFKVIRLKNTEELGTKIVVQGGTFYNDAVLRAIEIITGHEVVRPDIAGIMGAYGAALIAAERCGKQQKSALLGAKELSVFKAETSTKRCQGCGNHCLITIQRFPNGKEYYAGNRCDRGSGQEAAATTVPSIYVYKNERLFSYVPLAPAKAQRGTIGIPRVLNMYEDYPFWFAFFTKLGYRVLLSAKSSPKLFEGGLETIPSETACYPAKLAHGHVENLIRRGIKKIFYPCIPQNIGKEDADKCFNCPVVAAYPENIAANMDALGEEKVTFWHPFISLRDPRKLLMRLSAELASEEIPMEQMKSALDKAYEELEAYKADVRNKGAEILSYISEHGLRGVVLAGRPYHVDSEINHGLPEMLQSFGLPVLSEDVVAPLVKSKEHLRVVDQWEYHSRLYAAAEFVGTCQQARLELIQLNSFGCGLDAVTIDQTRELLDSFGKIHTVIKLDEISNLGAARIRIRSLLAALDEKDSHECDNVKTHIELPQPALFTKHMKKDYTLLAPQMSPVHFQFVATALQQAGYRLEIPALDDRKAIDTGLKYVNNDACYPAILVIGQIISALQSGKYDLAKTAVMMVQTGGGCRASNYIALLRKALADAGMAQVPVASLWGEKSPGFTLTLPLAHKLFQGVLYGDLLLQVLQRVRPYELRAGSANELYAQWSERCCASLRGENKASFKEIVYGIVHAFDALPIDESIVKPRVGIVGEILVKYHPTANNGLIKLLEQEQAEVVVPNIMNFFLYCAYDRITKYELLSGSWPAKAGAELFIKVIELYRRDLKQALTASRRFSAPHTIKELAAMAQKHLSLGNMSGEGWLLTGEIVALLRSGVNNIACVQPFGCLPNHIVAKGMFKELRLSYPKANIVSLDYDPAASEVNQLNRIKLMLSVATEEMNKLNEQQNTKLAN